MEIITSNDILLIIGIAVVALLIIGLVFARLYKRASKELSFVRTGFGGQKVIMNGGALVFPVLHEVITVNMNTIRLVVSRKNEQALITRDRMRVDATAEFYLRVKPEVDAIAFAAQTLGQRTISPDQLKELMEGKFVDALRAVAAEMGMEELHEKRTDFVQKVQNAVKADLEKNGLELETVSLTGLDQTDKQYFNANNAFDAQGLTKLTETIEEKKKVRNDIEQNTSVAIKKKDLEAEKERLELEREEEFARAAQQRAIANQAAVEATSIAKEKAENDKISQEAEIVAQKEVETAKIKANREIDEERILNEQAIKERDIEREKTVEITDQDRDIAVADKSKERSKAEKEARLAEAEAVAASEKVITAKETEVANRNKQIAVIKATEEAEEKAVSVKVAAAAEKTAALDKAAAIKTTADAEAEAIKIKATADEERYKVEAEGNEKLNSAENVLSDEIIQMRIQIEKIKHAASIIEASVKPIEAISDMKVVNVGGLNGLMGSGGVGNGYSGNGHGSGNMAEDLVNSLLKYRGLAPIVDNILHEVGIEPGSLKGLTQTLENGTAKSSQPEPVQEKEVEVKAEEVISEEVKAPSKNGDVKESPSEEEEES
ncbi:MAG: flotillin family protein [Balneola sp.]|nr:MAG: flotillin family protein [Balneola sp.]